MIDEKKFWKEMGSAKGVPAEESHSYREAKLEEDCLCSHCAATLEEVCLCLHCADELGKSLAKHMSLEEDYDKERGYYTDDPDDIAAYKKFWTDRAETLLLELMDGIDKKIAQHLKEEEEDEAEEDE